ncbi:hypothetical protein EYC51_16860 [Alcaligenes faecalis]|nr:hypothetical protein EYC51_16860 [Alcaligenes faecalis]
MSQQPLFWYRPRSDGGYEGPLHNGQIEDIRKASGAWVPLFAGAAPVNAEPSDDEIIDIAVEPLGIDCDRMPYGVVVFARALLSRYSSAPVVTQPDVTQQTLDDVMAGIPARDAEIEALRKEIETLRAAQAQQPVSGADRLPIELCGISEAIGDGGGFWRSCSGCHELNEGMATGPFSETFKCHLGVGCSECGGIGAIWDTTDYDAMADFMAAEYQKRTENTEPVGQDQLRDAAQMIEPSGNSGELPDAARVPLDSLHADAVYLLSRVKQETLSIHDAALSIQHHIDSARAALAQQDAETGKSVSVENQGLTQQTSHHCDDACHEWRQERTPCPDGQCKVRNDAEAFKYWGRKETWVRYLTDHTGLIQITARDIATCNAALDAVKNALSPGAVQQDADKVKADLLSSLVEIVGAVIASDEEGLIEHSETIIKARAAIDSARKEQA